MTPAADQDIREALRNGQVIDITTTGRSTGEPRRVEIVFHNLGGSIYISGMARVERRAWLANLEADPRFVFHLKGRVKADLPARARVITEESERRQILEQIAQIWRTRDVEAMVTHSPLIEVTFEDSSVLG